MRSVISFPIPFDNFEPYRHLIKRFTDTFKKYDPGCEYEVWAMCNWGEPTDQVREWFYGLKTRFVPYCESGCDLGGHQYVARLLYDENPDGDDLIIGMTSRCYFHRAGWLNTMVELHRIHGGLIGCSASKQGGNLHLCTRAFAMTVADWMAYPHFIRTRKDGPMFEVGTNNGYGSLLNWYSKHRGCVSVAHWDGIFKLPDEWDRYAASKGRFRDGEQNAMLVHDFHTEQFALASEGEKLKLNQMFLGNEP